jgi:PKHD-type hydroxylase
MKNLHRSYIPEHWSKGVDHIQTNYFYFDNFLTEEQCEEIKTWGSSTNLYKATVASLSSLEYRKEMRQSEIAWLPISGWEWLYDRIFDSVDRTNKWEYDIRGFGELIQFTKYDPKDGASYYNLHRDTGPSHQHRKISFVILLDDPENFSGGEFFLEHSGKIEKLKKGTAIMFPSFLQHQVLPVTSGIRHSLVCWISGPKLK